MKRVNLVCLLALLVCAGCKRGKPEVKTAKEPVEESQVVGGTDVVSRIKALYIDIGVLLPPHPDRLILFHQKA